VARHFAIVRTVQSRRATIAYESLGSGEPALFFLPGWCATHAAFDEVTARLSSHYRTLALDWRGHAASSAPPGDFGFSELVDDALAVLADSGAESVVPIATAHAGWVAIELRRRLGSRVGKLVLVDWIVTDPPPPFVAGLSKMLDPDKALEVRDALFAMWALGVDNPAVLRFVRDDMGRFDAAMWARAAREILAGYHKEGSPLRALATLAPSVPVLHVYAQPPDPAYLAAQQSFAAGHAWFEVERLEARSHFPTLEVPGPVAASIRRFVA
jgi:pimeloyl-ACP methyl ester carboxylesterase